MKLADAQLFAAGGVLRGCWHVPVLEATGIEQESETLTRFPLWTVNDSNIRGLPLCE